MDIFMPKSRIILTRTFYLSPWETTSPRLGVIAAQLAIPIRRPGALICLKWIYTEPFTRYLVS